MKAEGLDSLVNLSARRGIVLPAYSIYGEAAGLYDYGPIGVRIKNKIVAAWRRHFIDGMGNFEIEATIVGPDKVFEASGHLKTFTDPITVCGKCGASYRADKLLAEHFEKAGKVAMAEKAKHGTLKDLSSMLAEERIKCEKCGAPLTEVTPFNLMLGTKLGPTGKVQGYLRPETAQGIFVDFKQIYRTNTMKLPMAIGQTGRVFRNEISPRNMLIRMREFSQMELEYFFDPEDHGPIVIDGSQVDESVFDTKVNFLTRADQNGAGPEYRQITLKEALSSGHIPNKLMAYVLYEEQRFMLSLGFKQEQFRFREMLEDELPHYSKGNVDLEARLGGSFEEVAGNAYRSDFDLKNHERMSGEDMSVLVDGRKFIPHVVEQSWGVDRLFWCLLANSLYYDEARGWEVLLLNEALAPYAYAVFPLQKDDKLTGIATAIVKELKARGVSAYYSATASIGKRYARADEIGVPYAITVDFQSVEDGTATVRGASDTKQQRVPIKSIGGIG